MYLVSKDEAYYLASMYTDFWKTLTWYRMYCIARFGKNKSDYKKGLESLKGRFADVFELDSVSQYIKEPVTTLIKNIENRLERKRFTDEDIEYISDLLWDFEKKESEFTATYFDAYFRQSALSDLPKGMSSVLPLLENEEYNSAIVDSFKYFDWLLQRLLNASPHDYYGETLVNLAFSPRDGRVKLGTHENEQVGLRNLASGLYALFRNPAAHRDIFDISNGILRFDGKEQTAGIVTVMVSLLSRLVYETVYKNLEIPLQEELIRIAQKHSWNQNIIQWTWNRQYSLGIGLLAEAKHKTLRDCQLVVTFTEDDQGPHLLITIHADLEKEEVEELTQTIHQMSNLRTVIQRT